jgi:IMP dehydrogenase
MAGGLKAGMGYCGVHNLKSYSTKTKFIRISGAGLKRATLTEFRLPKKRLITVFKVSAWS